MWSNLSTFSFMDNTFGVNSKNSLPCLSSPLPVNANSFFPKCLLDIIQWTNIYSVVTIYISYTRLILEIFMWGKTSMGIVIMVPKFLQENRNSNNHTNQYKIKSVMNIISGNAMRACNKKIWSRESCCEKWSLTRCLKTCKHWQWTTATWEGEIWVFQTMGKSG